MIPINQIKPAEALILLYGKESNYKEIMRTTFYHLLFKRVLEISVTTRGYRSGRNNKVENAYYVTKGINFNNYTPSNIEETFLSPFRKSPSLKAVLKTLVKLAHQSINSEKRERWKIIAQSSFSHCYSVNFITVTFNWFKLTYEGQLLKQQLTENLTLKSQELSKEIHRRNYTKAIEILNLFGSSIFCKDDFNFSILDQIDTQTSTPSMFNSTNQWVEFLNSNTILWTHWNSIYSLISMGYESSVEENSSNGCSSCTSCTSCSGCSGCGGCGGCS